MKIDINTDYCKSLGEVRELIDVIDKEIISLIAKRYNLTCSANVFKKSESEVRSPKRVEEVLEKVRMQALKSGIDVEFIQNIYTVIIPYSIEKQLEIFNNARK